MRDFFRYIIMMEVRQTEPEATIHTRIGELRKTLSLTQQEFADAVKLSQTYVAAIESGRRRVNERISKIIAFTFGVNEDYLARGTLPMFRNADERKLERVLSDFKKLDPLLQDYVLKQLSNLLEYQEQRDE